MDMQALTKTEQTLLNRSRMDNSIWIDGIRECNAARKLVAKGLAAEFVNLSGYSRGEYKVSPFTRKSYITKTIYVAAGTLKF